MGKTTTRKGSKKHDNLWLLNTRELPWQWAENNSILAAAPCCQEHCLTAHRRDLPNILWLLRLFSEPSHQSLPHFLLLLHPKALQKNEKDLSPWKIRQDGIKKDFIWGARNHHTLALWTESTLSWRIWGSIHDLGSSLRRQDIFMAYPCSTHLSTRSFYSCLPHLHRTTQTTERSIIWETSKVWFDFSTKSSFDGSQWRCITRRLQGFSCFLYTAEYTKEPPPALAVLSVK